MKFYLYQQKEYLKILPFSTTEQCLSALKTPRIQDGCGAFLVPPAGIEPAQYRYRGILSVLHRLRSVQIGNDSLHNRRIYRCGLCNIEQFEKGCFGAHKHRTNTTIYDAYMPVAACAFCRILVYSDQGTVIRRQAVGLSLEKGG